MRFKILMTGGQAQSTAIEAEMLKDKGFMVYTCETRNACAMIDEVYPDVVYINAEEGGINTSKLYKSIISKDINPAIPVILTLLEDDTYLLKKKHPVTHKLRHIICDNLLDAIKISITGIEKNKLRATGNHTRTASFTYR